MNKNKQTLKMAKRFSKKLPDGFQSNNLGTCVYASYLIAKNNLIRGYTDFSVVNGRAVFKQLNGDHHDGFHVFILRRNGKIYDPTYQQFFNYPTREQPHLCINYRWADHKVYTPEEFIKKWNFTEEFKKFCYKKTKRGEFFKGAVFQFEKDNPELIPEKFRI